MHVLGILEPPVCEWMYHKRRIHTFSASIFRAVTSLLFSFSSARRLASAAREYRQCLNCDVSWNGVGPGVGRTRAAGVAEPDSPGVPSFAPFRDGPASFVIVIDVNDRFEIAPILHLTRKVQVM